MSNKGSDKNVGSIEELIKEYKTYNDLDGIQGLSIYINALKHLLAELEQDKKRIQELEEKVETKQKFIIMANEVIENSIPNQVVIDKIEGLRNDIKLGNCRYPYINEHKIDVLQELLREDK